LTVLWVGSQMAAAVLGAGLPAAARLDMAAPLALVGLLARSAPGRSASIAAMVAVVVSAGGAGLPFRSTTLVAILTAIAVAMLVERAPVARIIGGVVR
jgi:predicted branched-subunit amino acid permease